MGFSRDDIYRLLRAHKENVGRCAILRADIQYVENLSNIKSDALIEEMAFRSSSNSGMPSGTGISDPTSSIAVKVADRRAQIAREWGKNLIDMETELYERLRDLGYVDGWLSGLKEREKLVVEKHIIDGIVWDKIPDLIMASFPGDTYSLEGVRKIQKRAIKKILKMTER